MGVLHRSESVEAMLMMECCIELGMQLIMYSRKGALYWNYRVCNFKSSNKLIKELSYNRTQKFKPQYQSHCTWSWTSPILFIPSQPLSLSTIIMFLDIIHRLVFCLKSRPVCIKKQNVSETGFYLCPQNIIIILIYHRQKPSDQIFH
jgi:hypothetical protein